MTFKAELVDCLGEHQSQRFFQRARLTCSSQLITTNYQQSVITLSIGRPVPIDLLKGSQSPPCLGVPVHFFRRAKPLNNGAAEMSPNQTPSRKNKKAPLSPSSPSNSSSADSSSSNPPSPVSPDRCNGDDSVPFPLPSESIANANTFNGHGDRSISSFSSKQGAFGFFATLSVYCPVECVINDLYSSTAGSDTRKGFKQTPHPHEMIACSDLLTLPIDLLAESVFAGLAKTNQLLDRSLALPCLSVTRQPDVTPNGIHGNEASVNCLASQNFNFVLTSQSVYGRCHMVTKAIDNNQKWPSLTSMMNSRRLTKDDHSSSDHTSSTALTTLLLDWVGLRVVVGQDLLPYTIESSCESSKSNYRSAAPSIDPSSTRHELRICLVQRESVDFSRRFDSRYTQSACAPAKLRRTRIRGTTNKYGIKLKPLNDDHRLAAGDRPGLLLDASSSLDHPSHSPPPQYDYLGYRTSTLRSYTSRLASTLTDHNGKLDDVLSAPRSRMPPKRLDMLDPDIELALQRSLRDVIRKQPKPPPPPKSKSKGKSITNHGRDKSASASPPRTHRLSRSPTSKPVARELKRVASHPSVVVVETDLATQLPAKRMKIDDFGEHDVIMVDDPNACKTGSSSVLTEHNNNNPASSSCDVQSSNVATKQLLPPPPNDRVKSTPAINKSVKPSSDQHHPRQIGNPSKPRPRRPIMSSALTDLIAAKSIDGASKKSVSSSTNATTSNGSGNDDLPLDLTLCSRLSPPPPKRHASSNGRISNTSSSSVSSTVNSGLLPTTATTSTKPQNQPGIDEITQWVTEAVANFYHRHHQQQIALVRSTFVPNHPSWHSCPHAVQLANPNICNQFKQPIPVTPTTLCQLMTSPQGQLIHNIQSTSGQQPQLYAVDASGSANQPALPPIHFQQHPIIIPTIPLPPNQPGNTALQASYLTHPHLAFSPSQPLVLTDNQLMPPPTVFHHTTNPSMLMVNGNQLLSPSPVPTVTTNSLSGQVNQLTQQPIANLMTLNSATTLIGQPSSSSHSTNNGSGESSSSTPRYALF